MNKHLPPPDYFKIFALLGACLLVIGLGLLVSHVTAFNVYMLTYGGVALLAVGVVGMFMHKPKA